MPIHNSEIAEPLFVYPPDVWGVKRVTPAGITGGAETPSAIAGRVSRRPKAKIELRRKPVHNLRGFALGCDCVRLGG